MSTLTGIITELARLMAQQEPGVLSRLAFEDPPELLDPIYVQALDLFGSSLGSDIMPRFCCALGGTSSKSLNPEDLRTGGHEYRPKSLSGVIEGGGINGFIYTRYGGFIDLGHVRDYADYTRFFGAKFFHAPNQGITQKLFSEAADMYLVVAQRNQRPDPALAALVGATLAYQRSIWHEIITYFPDLGEVIDQKYSSFAPEDNFSNAVGTLVGYRAFNTVKKPFNSAVDAELMRVLDDLGAMTKSVTNEATEYVKDHWWKSGILFDGLTPNALRRNLDAFSPVMPWLVTDIEVENKTAAGAKFRKTIGRPTPARIEFPEEVRGQKISDLARIEFRNLASELDPLLPPSIRNQSPSERVITANHLPAMVNTLRAKIRVEEGNERVEPGPPVI